jgi:hypothetical protein
MTTVYRDQSFIPNNTSLNCANLEPPGRCPCCILAAMLGVVRRYRVVWAWLAVADNMRDREEECLGCRIGIWRNMYGGVGCEDERAGRCCDEVLRPRVLGSSAQAGTLRRNDRHDETSTVGCRLKTDRAKRRYSTTYT